MNLKHKTHFCDVSMLNLSLSALARESETIGPPVWSDSGQSDLRRPITSTRERRGEEDEEITNT